VCYRLWSESTHASLAAQAAPEILEADLAPLALELACWGASDPLSLAWLDPPPPATLTQAKELLRRLEAIDEHGQATPIGRRMASLGTHPRLAHMIERAAALGLADLACDIAGLLSERDPLRAQGMQRDPDLRHRLDVLRGAPAPAGFAVDGRALQQVRRSSELFARRSSRDDSTRAGAEPQLARD
jgi:ATP-dependent helicase HrpB